MFRFVRASGLAVLETARLEGISRSEALGADVGRVDTRLDQEIESTTSTLGGALIELQQKLASETSAARRPSPFPAAPLRPCARASLLLALLFPCPSVPPQLPRHASKAVAVVWRVHWHFTLSRLAVRRPRRTSPRRWGAWPVRPLSRLGLCGAHS